jgi:hypothetical protein
MPTEENEENTTEGVEPELSEYPVSDQELLDALGLDENLQPRGAEKGEVEEKGPPESDKDKGKPDSASGENADDEVVEEEEKQEEGSEEGETDVAAQSAEDEEEKLPPKGSMQHRINQLTQRTRELEANTKELEAKLEAAAPMMLQPTAKNPLTHLTTEKAVRDEMRDYREMKAWCWRNLNGGELTDTQGRSHDLSGEEVRGRLAFAEDMLQQYIPERIAFLREQAKYDAITREAYPMLYDSNSQESRLATAFLQQYPELMNAPNHQLIIGDAIRGMYARLAEQPGKSGGKAAATNGSKIPAGKSAPKLAPRPIKGQAVANQKATQSSAQRARLEREFMSSGDKRSLEAFILSTL